MSGNSKVTSAHWVRRARLGIFGAAMLSLGVHFAGAAFAPQETRALEEGGGEPSVAAIGESFADMMKQGDELSPVEMPDMAEPIENTHSADTANTAEPVTEAAQPQLTIPVQAQATPTPPTDATQTVPFATADRLDPSQPSLVPMIEAPADEFSPPTAMPFMPAEPQIAMVVPAAPTDVVEAKPDQPVLPVPPVRPWRAIDQQRAEQAAREAREAEQRRAERRQAEQRRAEQRRAEQRRAQANQRQRSAGKARGNSNQSARRGTASGSSQGQSARSSSGGRSKSRASGNAAASNYPGLVRRDLARTRKRRAGGRGTATIRFTITGGGGLASARVARSSGNSKVDKAALNHVRRSAPFPRPPAGAQRTFTIPIQFGR
ncbi:MAG: TonB family protein [Pseudomonadota bacterium]